MKYKNQLKKLLTRQKWWDNQNQKFQNATTRPGSLKK